MSFEFYMDYDAEGGGKVLLNENDVETVVQLSKGNIDRDSSERKSIAKTDDIGMISGYNKGNKAPEITNVKIGKTASVHAGEGRGDHAGAQALWGDLEKDGAKEYQSIFCRLLWNYRA
jgi:hypothetical protein